ncbi:PmeII family type II restriction endonuclease [uncultured Candidatus Kuenenia sp.]|nr:PmeII family type II restriction endonuclease [uncultured Candidatus Kuenenia sp.]MBE7545762.1 hypothetical protein [Planctomycetia bacterium]MCL4743716.1 hypothetical protein [Phycisphaerales bacterium]
MNYDEKDLIVYLCKKISGIGDKTASAISVYLENLSNLFENIEKLNDLRKVSGKKLLDPKQIKELSIILTEYFPKKMLDIRYAWISVLIRDFVKNSIKEIKETTLDTLLINPFLIKAFGFDDHCEVVTFYFYQKVTRSIVTSWGFIIEGVLLCSGAEKSDLEGFDIMITREEKEYHFQVKTSPNTMSIEQVRQLNAHIQKIKDISKQVPMLGMTYGKREQINTQIQSTLIGYPKSAIIGKEFWDFIAKEEGYCKKILNWINEVMELQPTNFSETLEEKKLSLIKDWENTWGKGKISIDNVLKNYL